VVANGKTWQDSRGMIRIDLPNFVEVQTGIARFAGFCYGVGHKTETTFSNYVHLMKEGTFGTLKLTAADAECTITAGAKIALYVQ
jgi:hypothetical protein